MEELSIHILSHLFHLILSILERFCSFPYLYLDLFLLNIVFHLDIRIDNQVVSLSFVLLSSVSFSNQFLFWNVVLFPTGMWKGTIMCSLDQYAWPWKSWPVPLHRCYWENQEALWCCYDLSFLRIWYGLRPTFLRGFGNLIDLIIHCYWVIKHV